MFWIFQILFTLNLAHAEYRVFELVIQNTETQSTRTVASTLDPFQYPDYYPVGPTETVLYQETWMCYGDTSYHKKLCPNPKLAQNPNPAQATP